MQKNLRAFARFIRLERKSLGEFSKEQLADIPAKETRNAANFNAFFLVLASRFVDMLSRFDYDCDAVTNSSFFVSLEKRILRDKSIFQPRTKIRIFSRIIQQFILMIVSQKAPNF